MAKLLSQAPAHGFVVSISGKLEFDIKTECLPPAQFQGAAETKLPAGGEWPLRGKLHPVTGVTLEKVFNDTTNMKYRFGSNNLEFVKFYDDDGKLLGEIHNEVFLGPPVANHDHGEGIGTWKVHLLQ